MYYVGLDLGQKRDYSAVIVVGTAFEKLLVRFAERMPLGMPYPNVVERVRTIVRSDELLGNCVLVVDATGVGAPVVDMLRAAELDCEICAVTITGGARGGTKGSVPKQDLIALVQMLLESGKLRIGKLREAAGLVRELKSVRTSVRSSGRFGAAPAGMGNMTIWRLRWRWRAGGWIGAEDYELAE